MKYLYNNTCARVYVFLLLAVMMTGCESDVWLLPVDDEETPVVADIAFSVARTNHATTRMSGTIVQEEGYRGIKIRQIVPFAVSGNGKITASDRPKRFYIVDDGEKPVDNRPYYYYESCSIMQGVNAFLSYGRAIPENGKAVNGSLVETFPLEMAPNDIRFSLESVSERTAHTTATALADYMTAIANAQGNSVAWKNAPNNTLKVMRLNFVNQTEAASNGELLPGSAADIRAYTSALKTTLNTLTLTGDDDIAIREAIFSKIDDFNGEAWNGFPASIGLPDGAAVIRWNNTNERFEVQLSTTELVDINGLDRFAYPAELYYYGNSRIKTSNIDKRKDSYTDREWSAVLADYEYDNGAVSTNTTAVAIKEPLQYGVAHLKILLKRTGETLADAKGTNVTVGATSFPLTGIIVGGQLPVGFDFTPTTAYPTYSEADMKYIYDSQVKTNGASSNEYVYLSATADATKMTNILVLQTYDHQKVPVVLEFVNNSANDFVGIDGIVYKGTKFYLVGEVDPSEFSEDPRTEIRDRVFTQDYTTTLNMKVTGLQKAYNVVPNLLSPRLEMGIELVPAWVATTPEEVIF